MVRLNHGQTAVYSEDDPANGIIEAGKQMEAELANIQFATCKVCCERRPDNNIHPKTGRCQRCQQENPKDNLPFRYSKENNMIPGPQPPELANLTLVEQVCIAMAHTQTRVVSLKGGGSRMKGSSITFGHDVKDFFKRLPIRPDELPIIILRRPNQPIKLIANRHKIEKALRWLAANNKHYRGVVDISQRIWPCTQKMMRMMWKI